jgi:adenylyl-sulfate kinase
VTTAVPGCSAAAPFTLWLTGLPSSGKSTLARLVEAEVRARGFPIAVLDGDEVRTWLTADLGFSRADREENLRRIAHLAAFQNRAGVTTVTAAISPFRSAREAARRVIERFVEVYVDCPLEVCEGRDVKGLYKRARRGEIAQFTGVSDPYEPPEAPEILVQTDRLSAGECIARIMEALETGGHLPRGLVRREALLPRGFLDGLSSRAVAVVAAVAATRERGARDGGPLTREEWRQVEQGLAEQGYLRLTPAPPDPGPAGPGRSRGPA